MAPASGSHFACIRSSIKAICVPALGARRGTSRGVIWKSRFAVAGLDPDLLLRTTGVRYARSEGLHVAYRVIVGRRGGVSDVVLMLAGTASMESFFEDAVGVRLLGGLADL